VCRAEKITEALEAIDVDVHGAGCELFNILGKIKIALGRIASYINRRLAEPILELLDGVNVIVDSGLGEATQLEK
jgi:hypothetical protein